MKDVPNNATCYDCALHRSHRGGFCNSKDLKNPCGQIEYNYEPYEEYRKRKTTLKK